MPSTYAHYRMGQQVRQSLAGRQREVVEAWPELYLIGLHGPDILFYYKPLSANPVKTVGHALHERPGRSFFSHACRAVRESRQPEAALAYAYGLLNHFALDMSCHPYVNGLAAAGRLTHTEIEVEFDRSLMVADGLDPVTFVQTGHIHPTAENAGVIAPFYPVVTAGQVEKALKGMVFYHNLLMARTAGKRRLLSAGLLVAGRGRELQGLVIRPEGNPQCVESSARLRELYAQGQERAVRFLQDFDACLAGARPLPEPFRCNFEGRA